MAEWALLKGNVIANIIVTHDDDKVFANNYVKEHDNDYDGALDIATLTDRPSIGWVKKGSVFVAPEVAVTSKDKITGDGKDTATVTYTDHRDGPPASIKAQVNGQEVDVLLVGGVGSLDVTSTTPGDMVVVSIGGVGALIGVQ